MGGGSVVYKDERESLLLGSGGHDWRMPLKRIGAPVERTGAKDRFCWAGFRQQWEPRHASLNPIKKKGGGHKQCHSNG